MSETFDELSDVYEAMVNWPKRLEFETPFFRWLFDTVTAKRVVDVACGPGHHVAMFHSWGLEARGADLSASMIEKCKAVHGEGYGLNWRVRGFDQPPEQPGHFDVAICIGNSLALAADEAMVGRVLEAMIGAVRPGGAIMIHLPNVWKLDEGRPEWQKCLRTRLAAGDSVIAKGMHRCGRKGFVDVVVAALASDPPAMRTACMEFLAIESGELKAMAGKAGASRVEFFGTYKRDEYVREKSQDLIMVAIH